NNFLHDFPYSSRAPEAARSLEAPFSRPRAVAERANGGERLLTAMREGELTGGLTLGDLGELRGVPGAADHAKPVHGGLDRAVNARAEPAAHVGGIPDRVQLGEKAHLVNHDRARTSALRDTGLLARAHGLDPERGERAEHRLHMRAIGLVRD